MDQHPRQPDPAAFFAQFAPKQGRIFAYILALLPHWADAEECFQETCVALWENFDQFDPDAPGSDFFRWACRFAYHRVLHLRRDQRRDRAIFSENLVEAVADVVDARADELSDQLEALRQCVAKLSEHERELLRIRYDDAASDASVQQYAEQIGRPADTLYKQLNRIRRRLLECVTRTLADER